jgi:uroporphyrinogen decarboxylase
MKVEVSSMKEKERLLTALSGGQPDRVPTWELVINEPVIQAILGKQPERKIEGYIELAEELGIEGLTAFESMDYREVDEGVIVDEWGIKYKTGERGEKFPIDGPVENRDDLKELTPPDPKADYRWEELRELKARFGEGKAIAVCIHDAFEYPWFLRGGMDDFLLDTYRNPALVKEIIETVLDYNVALIEEAADLGADFVCSGDDYAYKAGPLISPEQFAEFFQPGLQRVVEAAHENDLLFLKHSDGDIRSLLDQFLDAGIDALCPLEPAAGMDIGEIKKEYGDRIALVGNIDCSDLLVRGTESEVRSSVKRCISSASPGGGHVLSSSNSIHHDVDPDNYLAMLEALEEFGEYPLSF